MGNAYSPLRLGTSFLVWLLATDDAEPCARYTVDKAWFCSISGEHVALLIVIDPVFFGAVQL